MPDEERKAWESLWAEVAEILRKAEKQCPYRKCA
jgi:hypothetical protein